MQLIEIMRWLGKNGDCRKRRDNDGCRGDLSFVALYRAIVIPIVKLQLCILDSSQERQQKRRNRRGSRIF